MLCVSIVTYGMCSSILMFPSECIFTCIWHTCTHVMHIPLIVTNPFSFTKVTYGVFPSELMLLRLGVAVASSLNVKVGFAMPSVMLVNVNVLVNWRC